MSQLKPLTEALERSTAKDFADGLDIAGLQLLSSSGAPLLYIARWQMRPGVHWVHGASGAGKTRLLRHLAGLSASADDSSAPQAVSHAVVAGTAWHSQTELPRALCQKEVFFAEPERPEWDPMRIDEVHAQLLAPNEFGVCHLSAASQARYRAELLAGFGLTPHLHKAMYMLSTGTRRKVFLMAALLAPQRLVLLDEPSAALDQRSIQALHYALALRNRIAHQVTLVATAIEPQDHGQTGRAHWRLESGHEPNDRKVC